MTRVIDNRAKILLLDDDAEVRRVFRRFLSNEGHEVLEASTGAEALEIAGKALPHVAILDIAVPGNIKGWDVCKILKSHPRTKGMPVLLVSGQHLSREERHRGFALGADDYLVKPVDLSEFRVKIGNCLALASLGRQAPQQSILRRLIPVSGGRIFRREAVIVDLIHREVIVAGKHVPRLTARRFDVLLALLRHDGPVDQDGLRQEVWGSDGDLKTVQMTLARLREDLDGFPVLQIKTEAHSYEALIAPVPTKTSH